MKRFAFIYFGSLLLTICSCQKCDEATTKLIEQSRQYYEANATVITLPVLENVRTKAFGNRVGDIYPEWDKAIESGCSCAKMVEVPLNGTIRVVGIITKITDGKIKNYKSAVKSYLVLDYGGAETPKMYIETFIEKGKRCTMTARNSKEEATGFIVISEMNGAISDVKGYHEGLMVDVNRTTPSINKIAERGHDFFGFGMGYEEARNTKAGFCPFGRRYICPYCDSTYYAPIGTDPVCPICEGRYYTWLGTEYCPTCGRPWYQCTCENPAGTCAPCGRHSQNCGAGCQYSPDKEEHGICNCE